MPMTNDDIQTDPMSFGEAPKSDKDTQTASEALAEMTGEPKEKFEHDGEIPDVDEQDLTPIDEHEKQEAVVEHIHALVDADEMERAKQALRLSMWESAREMWFKRSDSWTDRNRPDRAESVARTVFEQWYSNNYE